MNVFYNDSKGILKSYWFLFNCLLVIVFSAILLSRYEGNPSYKSNIYFIWFIPITFVIPTFNILLAVRKYWYLPIKDNRIYIELLQKYSRSSLIYQKLLAIYCMNLIYQVLMLISFLAIIGKSQENVALIFRAYGVSILSLTIYTPIIFFIFIFFYNFRNELVCMILTFFIALYAIASPYIMLVANEGVTSINSRYLEKSNTLMSLKRDEKFNNINEAISKNDKQQLNAVIVPPDTQVTLEWEDILKNLTSVNDDYFNDEMIFNSYTDVVKENNVLRFNDKFLRYLWLMNLLNNRLSKNFGFGNKWDTVYYALSTNNDFIELIVEKTSLIHNSYSKQNIYNMLFTSNDQKVEVGEADNKRIIKSNEIFNVDNPTVVSESEKRDYHKTVSYFIPLTFMHYMSTAALFGNDAEYLGFEQLHYKLNYVVKDNVNYGVNLDNPVIERPLWLAIFTHLLLSIISIIGLKFIVNKYKFK